MTDVLAVCDSVAYLLEPDPTLRDDAHAKPPEVLPGRLYVWPRREMFASVDLGWTPGEERFWLRVAWAVSAEPELAAQRRDRRTSEQLHTRGDAMAVLVSTTPSDGATREHLRVLDIDYESLLTQSVRGFYMDLYGYQYREA